MHDNPQPVFIVVVYPHGITLIVGGRQFLPDNSMVNFRQCGIRISPGRGKSDFAHSKASGLKPCYGIFILIDDDAATRYSFSGGSYRLEGDDRGQTIDEVASFRKKPDID